ncbi:MAG TPA: hypothetical protein VFZ27_00275 [Terriglobia bacterium]|nr:hypothetical protein [Terriglobia bacterium]
MSPAPVAPAGLAIYHAVDDRGKPPLRAICPATVAPGARKIYMMPSNRLAPPVVYNGGEYGRRDYLHRFPDCLVPGPAQDSRPIPLHLIAATADPVGPGR